MLSLRNNNGEINFEEKSDINRLKEIEQIVLSSNQLLKKEVVPAIRILTLCNDSECY